MKDVRAVVVVSFVALALIAATNSLLWSATKTWDGGGADNNWNTAANWDADTVPANSDVLIFTGTGRYPVNNNFAANFDIESITFNSSVLLPLTITGNEFDLDSDSSGDGIIVDTASADHIINAVMRFDDVGMIEFEIGDKRTLTISNAIKDSGSGAGLELDGNGTLVLNGVSEFNDEVALDYGVLRLGVDNAVSSTQTPGIDGSRGTLDLFGHSTDIAITTGFTDGHWAGGLIVNTDTSTAGTLTGTITIDSSFDSLFGGDGDIIVNGDITTNSGSNRFDKQNGGGTLTLNKNLTSFTGGGETEYAGGTVIWDYTDDATDEKNGTSSRDLGLTNTNLQLVGHATVDVEQTMDDLDIQGGENNIRVTGGGAARTITLEIGDFDYRGDDDEADGGVISYQEAGTGTVNITVNESKDATYGIFGGAHTFVGSGSTATTWATEDGTTAGGNAYNKIKGLATFNTSLAANANVDLQDDATLSGAAMTVSTLRFNSSSGGDDITLTLDEDLTLGENGVLMTDSLGQNVTIAASGGTERLLVSGTGTDTDNLFIHQHETSNDLTISARLSSGEKDLVKVGAGALKLDTDSNDFTGEVYFTNGVLEITSIKNVDGGTSSLGAPVSGTGEEGAIYMGSANGTNKGTANTSPTLLYTGTGGNSSTDREIYLLGDATLESGAASGSDVFTFTKYIANPANDTMTQADLTLSGSKDGLISAPIALGALSTVTKKGTGTWTLSGVNTYGDTTVSAGTLIVSGTVGGDKLTETSATHTQDSTSTTNVNDFSLTASLVGRTIRGEKESSFRVITAVNDGTDTITTDRSSGTSTGSYEMYIDAAGPLGQGNVTIENGATLQVDGSNFQNDKFTVENGGTLSGGNSAGTTGILSGILYLEDGGKISPGSSSDSTTKITANAGYIKGATYVWDVSDFTGTAGVDWDLLEFSSVAMFDSSINTGANQFTIEITGNNPTGYTSDQNLILIADFTGGIATDYTGGVWPGGSATFDADYFNLDTTNFTAGGTWSITDNGTGNKWYLNYTAATVVTPEPSTYFMIAGVVFLPVLRFYRKRKNKEKSEDEVES